MLKVTMTMNDWREAADEALTLAVAALRDPDRMDSRSHQLREAAELLRARDTLNGRANIMANFEPDREADHALVEEPVS